MIPQRRICPGDRIIRLRTLMMCLTIAAAPLVFVGDEVTAVKKEYKNYADEENGALWDRFSLYLLSKGLSYDPHILRSTYLQFCREEERKAEAALGSREGPAEIDLMNVFRRLAEHDGAGLTANDLRDTALAFRALSLKKLSVYPHGAEVLQELKRRGNRIILLTNAQACFTIPELKWLGLYDLFDRIFISGEAGVKKPSPVFYALLAQNGYAPDESVMIGNDAVCDCQGAANAGMDSVFIRSAQSPKGRAVLPPKCKRIKELKELLSITVPGSAAKVAGEIHGADVRRIRRHPDGQGQRKRGFLGDRETNQSRQKAPRRHGGNVALRNALDRAWPAPGSFHHAG